MTSMPYSRIIDRPTKRITSSHRNKHIEYPCGCGYLFDHHIILERICSEHENELIAHHGWYWCRCSRIITTLLSLIFWIDKTRVDINLKETKSVYVTSFYYLYVVEWWAEEFSKNILDLDDKIRFAGVMEKSGHLYARCTKEGFEEYLKGSIRKLVFLRLRILLKWERHFPAI